MTRMRPGEARRIAKHAVARQKKDLLDLDEVSQASAQNATSGAIATAALEIVGVQPGKSMDVTLKSSAAIQQFVLLAVQAIKARKEANATLMGDFLDRAEKIIPELPDPSDRKVLDIVSEVVKAVDRIQAKRSDTHERIMREIEALA